MSPEALSYLSERDQESIAIWIEGILPLVEKYHRLQETDLVIEGGVGTGVTMAHMARLLFPSALYVGTDLAERLVGTARQSHAIDERALHRIQETNRFPSLGMSGATILANCLDVELIADIAAKTGKRNPTLVSFNALNALLDEKMNPWDKKYKSDMFSIERLVSMETPYIAQIHTGTNWKDEGGTSLSSNHYRLERVAQKEGWITERFDIGLLMVRP